MPTKIMQKTLPEASKQSHQHAEAFRLMNYQCQKCQHIEKTWNARDGVTPFGIRCPKCGDHMQHVAWGLDQYEPEHLPPKGQLVFITLPPELRFVLARLRVWSADGTEFELQGDEREEMIAGLADGFQDGEPFYFRWPW